MRDGLCCGLSPRRNPEKERAPRSAPHPVLYTARCLVARVVRSGPLALALLACCCQCHLHTPHPQSSRLPEADRFRFLFVMPWCNASCPFGVDPRPKLRALLEQEDILEASMKKLEKAAKGKGLKDGQTQAQVRGSLLAIVSYQKVDPLDLLWTRWGGCSTLDRRCQADPRERVSEFVVYPPASRGMVYYPKRGFRLRGVSS